MRQGSALSFIPHSFIFMFHLSSRSVALAFGAVYRLFLILLGHILQLYSFVFMSLGYPSNFLQVYLTPPCIPIEYSNSNTPHSLRSTLGEMPKGCPRWTGTSRNPPGHKRAHAGANQNFKTSSYSQHSEAPNSTEGSETNII